MYQYKLKEGAEGRIFINTVKNDDGTITSQTPLESPYLEQVQSSAPAANHITGVAPQNEQPTQPVQPTVQQNQQPINQEQN